jgi:hypothetical protein
MVRGKNLLIFADCYISKYPFQTETISEDLLRIPINSLRYTEIVGLEQKEGIT